MQGHNSQQNPIFLLIYVINSEMYELSQKAKGKFGEPLLTGDHDIVVQNDSRRCTDILCLIFFILFVGAFAGLLIYGLISGDPKKVVNVYNSDEKLCYITSNTQYGFFPTLGSVTDAVCVEKCPSFNQTVTCLPDTVNCKNGSSITANYSTTTFQYFCVPSTNINYQDLSQVLNTNVYSVWVTDLRAGWMVLVGAAVAAMIASLLFLCVVRCCSGCIIWTSIIICILGLEAVGIMFILQVNGIKVSPFISDNLSSLSINSLTIIGSGFMAAGFLFFLTVLCLRSRINTGSKSVELGAIFLFQNCCVILLPITQAIFVSAALGAIIIGGVYLYSMGNLTFPQNSAFPILVFNAQEIVTMVVYLVGGFWLLFFFLGCNSFILCSAVSIWYFNYESPHDLGAPFGDSIWRLIRYHPGSVAITSFINCSLEILKIIANLLSFEADENDNGCTSLCLKCLSFIFCLFKCFLRFLNDGTYVQMAVFGQGYCSSTGKAYDILSENATKIAITGGISTFFKLLGMMGIGVGITVAAYFTCQEVKYIASSLTNPLVVTIASGLIAFVIAGIYLTLIDLSAQSTIQCYFIDNEHNNGVQKYSRPQFKEIILVEGQ